MKRFFSFFSDLWNSRYLVWQLTKRDVTQRYQNNKLGMIWSIIDPLSYMVILYVIFGVGLRGNQAIDMPYICYLISGLSVVNFFNSTMSTGAYSIKSHAYLLKKVNIRLSILPVSTVLSGFIYHLIFLLAVFIVFFFHNVYPNWYWIQLLYYMFAMFMLLLGVTWFFAGLGVFFPDLQSVITVISRILFYSTPVFWTADNMPDFFAPLIRYNPLFYIAQGYRDSFYYSVPFWSYPGLTLYFWLVVFIVIVTGVLIFRRLRPHFADVI